MNIEEKIEFLRKRHPAFGRRVLYDIDNKGNEFCEIIYPNEKNPMMPIAVSVNEEGCLISVGQISNVTGRHPITVEQAASAIDDIVNEFVKKAETADGFIFGTPVHYAGMSGLLTSFMDRAFYSAGCAKNPCFKFKPAASVICARRAGTTATYDQINKYFGITQMPIISTRYWNMAFGRKAEDVTQDAEGMQALRILGNNMAYYLKCIEAGREKGITPPEQEKVTLTNFIR